ncbi:hypothetical protein CONPUDRAFT_168938 [Coniophora puteana RWD-64-598 SS2]|uniref:Uncharacterized protein n=1 Tax=Coniophora puteana (strain RWD-64-598) TaxID=741705 RepID=A0A5M3MBJ7_CONPW|nr:uncharacterized protein CONPUDRAFT_168938 [Coniophora puteana RWD-64-598 SS2]EIW76386.1 hypothetical protein CONPUDRAFT_168938 [Coniophora puteana RWD-64-598 SS2]
MVDLCTDGPEHTSTIAQDLGPYGLIDDSPCYVARVPVELLSRIFEHALPPPPFVEQDDERDDEEVAEQYNAQLLSLDDEPSPSQYHSPSYPSQMLVSHVCKRWRITAIATPSLWTSIRLTLKNLPPFTKAHTWIGRSGSVPLDINVYINDDEEYVPNERGGDSDASGSYDSSESDDSPFMSCESFEDLIAMLVSRASQWRSFVFAASLPEFVQTTINALWSLPPAPHLRHISIRQIDFLLDSPYLRPIVDSQSSVLGGASQQLKSIELWNVLVDVDRCFTNCHALTHLTISYYRPGETLTWESVFSVLRSAPALQSLTIRQATPYFEPTEETVVTLPALRELDLQETDATAVASVLRHLSFPNITTLHLSVGGEVSSDSRLMEILSESTSDRASLLSRLQHLALYKFPQGELAISVFEQLNSLKSLELSHGSASYRDDFAELVRRSDAALPSLQTLILQSPPMKAELSMIKSLVNRNVGPQLQELRIRGGVGDSLTDTDLRWLKEHLIIRYIR